MFSPGLLAEIVLITCSGALSPGPLSFAVVAGGMRRGWRFGVLAAAGHAAFEFPLFLGLALGAAGALSSPAAVRGISLLGGAALILFAFGMFREGWGLLRGGAGSAVFSWRRGGFATGLAFTALNPYFAAWWASAGLKVILDVWACGGLAAVLLAYPLHVWVDFAWLGLLAFIASRGGALSSRVQAGLVFAFGAALLYYGVRFLLFG